ncbi:hypothetical protein L5876_10395 [Hyphobacterium sp. SN044]|uniref:hypothetical protein n=1 Tax=Hyphobacterium sp. SN044 TaxID=2912575 RepID=UPI001F298351|nr:hypothetical protein [Hyphobacterium sp. SN044]MCF8880225.1 hypothetical protein [Hyphobacterium sp. SN044]
MIRALAGLALALAVSASALAQNNGLPDARQSVVFVKAVAVRGVECDLLARWQGAVLYFQAGREMARFSPEEQEEIATEIEMLSGEMACDDTALVGWTTGAAPNIEREVLPLYLVGYRAMAELDPPLADFMELTDNAAGLTTVEARIAELQEVVTTLEGGVTWEQFDNRMRNGAADIAAALRGEENTQFTAEEARLQMRHISDVALLWIQDQAEDE